MRKNSDPPENTVVIVLGARVFETHLSGTLQNRVQAASDYLKAHPKALCITTGGKGADEVCSEGYAAKQALIAKGIASERILAETRSTTTKENLCFAKEILQKNELGNCVLLSTQRYHQWRACKMASHIGLQPYSLVAKDRPRSLPKNLCREGMAILKFLLWGRKE